MPAAHIIQYCVPSPYQVSCANCAHSPNEMVCLAPQWRVISNRTPVCATTDRMPTNAM